MLPDFNRVKIMSLLFLSLCFLCLVEEILSYPEGIKVFLCVDF